MDDSEQALERLSRAIGPMPADLTAKVKQAIRQSIGEPPAPTDVPRESDASPEPEFTESPGKSTDLPGSSQTTNSGELGEFADYDMATSTALHATTAPQACEH
ncbi:hypothetical protein RMN57_34685 [Kitasatospora sp. CM 4170]|uniref:Uncharacterized protein n=1 Tax=Kitasatospora aburaviensis TaxID=67265 RepID=A0ABW1FDZ1_9ACTN|nr:hypothetical protein [Kitasatospora sp. CM 4170]WNM49480.1 hypothetical protein RMN57_34685 [Kitasatospora sp. CM 4170]